MERFSESAKDPRGAQLLTKAHQAWLLGLAAAAGGHRRGGNSVPPGAAKSEPTQPSDKQKDGERRRGMGDGGEASAWPSPALAVLWMLRMACGPSVDRPDWLADATSTVAGEEASGSMMPLSKDCHFRHLGQHVDFSWLRAVLVGHSH